MEAMASMVPVGIGATLIMDAWTLLRRRLLGTPLPDYGLVGRWLGSMARGRFTHERIASSPPVAGERVLGWIAHYGIGIAFAGGFLALADPPTPGSAIAFGLATVAAPFLLMQPGMGAGFAASRTARPNATRLQSLVTHAVFGAGLYAAALLLH